MDIWLYLLLQVLVLFLKGCFRQGVEVAGRSRVAGEKQELGLMPQAGDPAVARGVPLRSPASTFTPQVACRNHLGLLGRGRRND